MGSSGPRGVESATFWALVVCDFASVASVLTGCGGMVKTWPGAVVEACDGVEELSSVSVGSVDVSEDDSLVSVEDSSVSVELSCVEVSSVSVEDSDVVSFDVSSVDFSSSTLTAGRFCGASTAFNDRSERPEDECNSSSVSVGVPVAVSVDVSSVSVDVSSDVSVVSRGVLLSASVVVECGEVVPAVLAVPDPAFVVVVDRSDVGVVVGSSVDDSSEDSLVSSDELSSVSVVEPSAEAWLVVVLGCSKAADVVWGPASFTVADVSVLDLISAVVACPDFGIVNSLVVCVPDGVSLDAGSVSVLVSVDDSSVELSPVSVEDSSVDDSSVDDSSVSEPPEVLSPVAGSAVVDDF